MSFASSPSMSGGGLPPHLPPAAGGSKPPSGYDPSSLEGSLPFDSSKHGFQLPGDLERLAQRMGKSLGPDGTQKMENILQGMLMGMINSSRDANQQFLSALQEAGDDDSE